MILGLLILFAQLNLSLKDSIKVEHTFFPEKSKYIQELGAGYALGGIGWCIGATLAHGIWANTKDSLNAATMGGYSLYGLGTSIGVWWVGQRYDEGRYWTTVWGMVSLPLLLKVLGETLQIESEDFDEFVSFSLPIGAFIGYNLFRRKSEEGKR
ncbi:hypothetical protein KAW65_07820 [candidate division WOR-3 bacterium]|nr:hypothetical protein [candidate division WOR-3 bacterium]